MLKLLNRPNRLPMLRASNISLSQPSARASRLAIGAMGIVLSLGFCLTAARADDCSFSKGNVDQYRANCGTIDNCSNLKRMEAAVAHDCGTAADDAGPVPAPTAKSSESRHPEMSSEEIKKLQSALSYLGFDIGNIDGAIGPRTRQAITNVQQRAGLPVTGDIDQATLDAVLALAKEALVGRNAEAPQACAALDDLRQADFEREWRHAVTKISVLKELHQDISNLRNEMESDRFMQAAAWREVTAELLSTAKVCSNLVGNLLKFNPVSGAAVSVATRTETWGQRFLDALKAKKWGKLFLQHELETLALEVLLDYGKSRHPMIQATKTLYDFSNDMANLATIPANFSALRQTMDENIDNLDRQLKDMEQKLNDSESWMQMRAEMIDAANKACADEKNGPEISKP